MVASAAVACFKELCRTVGEVLVVAPSVAGIVATEAEDRVLAEEVLTSLRISRSHKRDENCIMNFKNECFF